MLSTGEPSQSRYRNRIEDGFGVAFWISLHSCWHPSSQSRLIFHALTSDKGHRVKVTGPTAWWSRHDCLITWFPSCSWRPMYRLSYSHVSRFLLLIVFSSRLSWVAVLYGVVQHVLMINNPIQIYGIMSTRQKSAPSPSIKGTCCPANLLNLNSRLPYLSRSSRITANERHQLFHLDRWSDGVLQIRDVIAFSVAMKRWRNRS